MSFSTEGLGGKKNRKNLNVELNLVPFIDLMSVNIAFLLITAVWVQVSMIQIGSSIYGKRNDDGAIEQENKLLNLRVNIVKSGYAISVESRNITLPKKDGEYDQLGLLQYLKEIKTKFPDKTDCIISLLDDIKYDEMIRAMDALMTAGFPEIAIATEGG